MKIQTREFFESAHRLVDYEEDCKRIHGHNWVVDIEINSNKLNKTGFIVDFKDIKAIIKELDHKLLLKDVDENRKLFNHLPKDWIVWLKLNPTCENLAIYIKNKIIKIYNLSLYQVSVTVYETYKPIKVAGATF